MNNYPIKKREFLGILFREKFTVSLTFIGLFALVLGLSFLMPPKYAAEAKLLVKSGREFQSRPDPGQTAAVEPYLTKQEVMNSELEILTSNDLVEATINRIGIDKLYPDILENASSDTR